MARGWESKSAAEQADLALARKHAVQQPHKAIDAADLELIRKKETLMLSRTRVVRDMERSQNPRYKQMLNIALTDLDSQLSEVAKACASRTRVS